MTRTLKAMGLALSAVAAQGHRRKSNTRSEPKVENAWITGEADPTSPAQLFSTGGAIVETCSEFHLDGKSKEKAENTETLLPPIQQLQRSKMRR